MKSAFFLALLSLAATSAQAGITPQGEFTCHTEKGKKFLINDEFAGKGHALVNLSSRKFFARHETPRDQVIQLNISQGLRARYNDYTIRLDMANAELTSRKEGNEVVHYYYIPAQVSSYVNLYQAMNGVEDVESAKCIQPAK